MEANAANLASSSTAAPSLERATREIRPLTGLRVPVMLAVLVLHSNLGLGYLQPVIGPRMPLFFILSGFVIALAYFPTIDRAMPLGKFIVRRFARLYPMLVVTTLLVAWPFFEIKILRDMHHGIAGPAFARSVAQTAAVTLVPPLYVTGIDAPMPNGYAWFAFVELSIGLLLPYVAWMAWRMPRYSLFAWALLLPALAHAWLTFANPRLFVGAVWPIGRVDLKIVPVAWLALLAFGVVMYRLSRLALASARWTTVLAWLTTPLCAVSLWMTFRDPPWARTSFGPVIVYLVLGLMIVALSLDRGGVAAWVLSSPPLNWLGKRSYSLYMMSLPMMKYFLPWAARTLGIAEWHERGVVGAIVMFVCVIGAGVIAYELVEKPMRKLIVSKFGR